MRLRGEAVHRGGQRGERRVREQVCYASPPSTPAEPAAAEPALPSMAALRGAFGSE